MSASADRHAARLVGRVLFLLALTIAGVGGAAIGTGPVAAAGAAVGPERTLHGRVRTTPHPVSVLPDSVRHRASERSRTDVVEPGATTRAPHRAGSRSRGGAVAYRRPSRVARRVPGRGPPVLHGSG